MTEAAAKRPRWVVLTLSLMPLWLGLSAAGAVWWSLRSDKQEEEERNQRFAMEMSVERIGDDLRKLEEVIGPRHTGDPASRKALARAASMLEGTLGPSNTGYLITKLPGPEGFPLICASVKSAKRNPSSLWVVAAYDTGDQDNPDSWPGNAARPLAGSSSALASLLAVAQAMARDRLDVDLHFMLLPHGNDPRSPCREMFAKLLQSYGKPELVFHIRNMADSPELVALVPESVSSEVTVPADLAQTLRSNIVPELTRSGLDQGLSIIEVQTRLAGTVGGATPADHIAISSGKLVEWLRRTARLQALK